MVGVYVIVVTLHDTPIVRQIVEHNETVRMVCQIGTKSQTQIAVTKMCPKVEKNGGKPAKMDTQQTSADAASH